MDFTTSGSDGQQPTELRCPIYPPPLDNATAAMILCKFYQLGCCRRGTSCRFIHPTDGESDSIIPESPGKAGPSIDVPTSTEPSKKVESAAVPADRPTTTTQFDPSKWINAPEFVPKSRMLDEAYTVQHNGDDPEKNTERDNVDDNSEEAPNELEMDDSGCASGMSYASIVKANNNDNESRHNQTVPLVPLCPYYEEHGKCAMPDCQNKHGLKCDLCERFCMHPDDAEQRQMHTAFCINQHEQAMEHSFAIQRSFDKTCGICLEVIMEKRPRERRFGILPNCKHIFCLSCIRTWRKANNFENKIKRGCPTCRIASDFVCPSYVWIESDDEKKKLIDDYKLACNATDCMHFKKGAAKCPFGNKCFYRHALVTGELIDVGAPPRRRERSRRRTSQGFRLDEFFEQFLGPAMMLDEHSVTFLTDEEDSDYDDFEHLTYDVEMNYMFEEGIPSMESLDSDDELLLSYFDI